MDANAKRNFLSIFLSLVQLLAIRKNSHRILIENNLSNLIRGENGTLHTLSRCN